MQRKVNGRAYVELFLYWILISSDCALSVLPEVIDSLRKNPGDVTAVFCMNQGLSITKDAPVLFGV